MLRVAGGATYRSAMEDDLALKASGSSNSTGASASSVSLRPENTSSGVQLEDTENDSADAKSSLNLKSSLGDRMAQPPGPPELPARPAASAKLDTDPIALPAVIEKARLKAERLEHAPPLPRGSNFVPRALGLGAALGTTFLAGLFSADLIYPAKKSPPSAPPVTIAATPEADLIWPDLLSPGPVSPRGQAAISATSDQAFELADAKLRGIGAPPDTEEARYWLRVGISKALASDRLRWALTQLGTLYVTPTAAPSDFNTARAVWELAVAKQDPVALCFLARLEEGSHGAPPNKALALKLFQQAKETGQCSGSEQAVERLSR